jgi:hypothetical protein
MSGESAHTSGTERPKGGPGADRMRHPGRRLVGCGAARDRVANRWDPGGVDYIVGTSAGSIVAALVCGVPLWYDGGGFALRPGPGGSRWRPWLGRNAIRPAVVSGWLRRGIVSTESLMDTVRRACAEDWAKHPNCCAMSVDHPTGTARGVRPDRLATDCPLSGPSGESAATAGIR